MLRDRGYDTESYENFTPNEINIMIYQHKNMTSGTNKHNSKQGPLDIKIKDGQIFISGEFIEQSKKGSVTTQRSFRMRQSYSIPEGVDTDNPKISKNNGEIKIIFKKLNNFKRKTRPLRRTVPIKPSPMDKTI